jgi:glutathione S-transferase
VLSLIGPGPADDALPPNYRWNGGPPATVLSQTHRAGPPFTKTLDGATTRRAIFSAMKLYITLGSPYARMARIMVLEKGLKSRVEIIVAKTRVANSPYYDINPSGRVPYLIRDDGVGLEESALICAYLDGFDGKPAFDLPVDGQYWEAHRLEAMARSLLDGLSVWGREILRPESERSPGVIQHETERARRMVDVWEREIDHRMMGGAVNMIHITLACALGLEARNPGFHWRARHPKLSKWFDQMAARPSITVTAPPSASAPSGSPPNSALQGTRKKPRASERKR